MTLPGLNHIAVTVRDLDVSSPWYRRLLGDPVLDERTDARFRHLSWLLDSARCSASVASTSTTAGHPRKIQ